MIFGSDMPVGQIVMTPVVHPGDAEPLATLRAAVNRLGQHWPGQAPLSLLVHHNPLQGYQHWAFAEALSRYETLTGIRAYLPDERFRQFFSAGRILESDLRAEYPNHPVLGADEVLLQAGQRLIRRSDLYTIALLYGLDAIPASQLTWQIEEMAVLAHFQGDVPPEARHRFLNELKSGSGEAPSGQCQAIQALWSACLGVLQLEYHPLNPEALTDLASYPVEHLLHPDEFGEACDETRPLIHNRMLDAAGCLLDELWQSLGTRHTLRTLMQRLTGEDLLDRVRGELLRFSAAHLDEGVATWPDPDRPRGLYANWREWQAERLSCLPVSPVEAVYQELCQLGIAPAQWEDYLRRLALELPGWAGLFNWRYHHPEYPANRLAPADLMDFLAVRLILDRQAFAALCVEIWPVLPTLPTLQAYFSRHRAEFFVRQALHQSLLPEYLAVMARRARGGDWSTLADMIHTWQRSPGADRVGQRSPHRDGWRLFRLAQHLGLTASEVQSISRETVYRLLDALALLTPDIRGRLWLAAYERRYRDELLNAVARNRGRWPDHDACPVAQVIFCMDEREEGMRRHLEEINPGIETLGTAGFFRVCLQPTDQDCSDTGQADRVQPFLRDLGLNGGFAPLVVLMQPGSASANNPYRTACAGEGRPEDCNAREYAAMLNRPEVRRILVARGLHIPEETWFLGAEHDTCTEAIIWYDRETLPSRFRPRFNLLNHDLEQAALRSAHERCRRFASVSREWVPDQALRHVRRRAVDFSQSRPELGHATHAAAIIGRRSISRGVFLDRRSFLISYEATRDEEGSRLEGILLTAVPVSAGINLAYYFSSVAPDHFGCGSRVTHNVVGGFGILDGSQSDLRTGLPRQMIEIHEPMRLLMLVEHRQDVLLNLLARQPTLAELIGNAWVQLASLDPDSGAIALYKPGTGFEPWEDIGKSLPEVAQSAAWYAGKSDPLWPALIKQADAIR